jgi:hypothetical protein
MGFHRRHPYLWWHEIFLSPGGKPMTLADITLLAFTACNSLRVLAYVPQIWKASTDKDGAKAISFSTWSLFLVSHLTTASYAFVNKGDSNLAYMFLINAVGCAAILAAAAVRRRHYHRKRRADALAAANVVHFKMRAAA